LLVNYEQEERMQPFLIASSKKPSRLIQSLQQALNKYTSGVRSQVN
jgi:hypothetical protein